MFGCHAIKIYLHKLIFRLWLEAWLTGVVFDSQSMVWYHVSVSASLHSSCSNAREWISITVVRSLCESGWVCELVFVDGSLISNGLWSWSQSHRLVQRDAYTVWVLETSINKHMCRQWVQDISCGKKTKQKLMLQRTDTWSLNHCLKIIVTFYQNLFTVKWIAW